MAARTPPARAGRREWLGLGAIALPCVLYSMDLTVLNLALPRLSADLRPGAGREAADGARRRADRQQAC